jgi:hypothetical protein
MFILQARVLTKGITSSPGVSVVLVKPPPSFIIKLLGGESSDHQAIVPSMD